MTSQTSGARSGSRSRPSVGGEYYLIEATSGAGKSSLCSYIYGWRGDYSGTISFDDRDIRELDAKAWGEIRRSSLSFLFQDMRLFDELTAWENVKLKNDLTKHKGGEGAPSLLRPPRDS